LALEMESAGWPANSSVGDTPAIREMSIANPLFPGLGWPTMDSGVADAV